MREPQVRIMGRTIPEVHDILARWEVLEPLLTTPDGLAFIAQAEFRLAYLRKEKAEQEYAAAADKLRAAEQFLEDNPMEDDT